MIWEKIATIIHMGKDRVTIIHMGKDGVTIIHMGKDCGNNFLNDPSINVNSKDVFLRSCLIC